MYLDLERFYGLSHVSLFSLPFSGKVLMKFSQVLAHSMELLTQLKLVCLKLYPPLVIVLLQSDNSILDMKSVFFEYSIF